MDNLKVGLIGLGSMGIRYAEIIHKRIKNATLIAVSSIVEKELDYVQDAFGIRQAYSNYKDLLALNELDAVFVVSSTLNHTRHMIDTIESGLHVFCEKPLALNVDDCNRVADLAARKPTQYSMVSFVRRFDTSYTVAKEKIKQGLIGEPICIRSQTSELRTKVGSKDERDQNGSIFLDLNVYDIDLARWFLGSEFESVYAVGTTENRAAIWSGDTVMSTCKMKNGTLAHLMASRTSVHGYDAYTEIVGTEGSIHIGRPAMANRVVLYDKHGARKECVQSYFERFGDAFQHQIQAFIDSIIAGKKLDISIKDAVEATRVGVALTKSYLLGEVVQIER